MSLRSLYQELILDHGRNPRNYGVASEPCDSCAGRNPVCGDELNLTINFDDKIRQLKFSGQGCAISVASASMMCQRLEGMCASDAQRCVDSFLQMLTTEQKDNSKLGKLAVFAGVRLYPQRVKCATLAWHALDSLLKIEQNKTVTTE